MARGEKENVNGPKDERRKQNNNVSPFQYWEENAEVSLLYYVLLHNESDSHEQ